MSETGSASFTARAIEALGRRGRRLAAEARWLGNEFARNPGLELHAECQHRKNRRFHSQVRVWDAAGEDPFLAAYAPREIPKIIWTHWAQGEAAAPAVVRRGLDSWRRLNPGWDIRVLDNAAADALVHLSDVPDFLPVRCFVNTARLRLLRQFGGLWTDATTMCHRPLDEWLPLQAASGFFVLNRPAEGRFFDNWFIASEPGGTLITAWEEAYSDYITNCTKLSRRYFMLIYALERRLRTDPEARAAWNRTARLPAPPSFLLMSALKGITPDETVRHAIRAGLPVSKLSWKSDLPDEAIERRLEEILGG